MKKLLLSLLLVCSVFIRTSYADPTPNNYVKSVTVAANTNGLEQLIDCSKAGMHTLSVIVSAGASATVIVQTIGANQDGTPNFSSAITAYTLLSAASGASSPLTVPIGAFSFYNIHSATSGVALTYIAGCR